MAGEEIEFDVHGEAVWAPRHTVQALAAAAAARAGVSSRHRDLSLVLGRALESGRVSLGSGEARALRAVFEEVGSGLGAAADELLRATDRTQAA